MKIALIICGPSRPTVEDVVRQIEITKSSFKDYDLDTYFFTYNDEMTKEVVSRTKIDNLILLQRQSDWLVNISFPQVECKNAKKGWCSQLNIWRLRQRVNVAINYLEDIDIITQYQALVYARPDNGVRIDPKKYLGNRFYNVVHCDYDYIDDRFGIARPDIFKKVWGYDKDKTELKEMSKVDSDEQYLRLICEQKEVECIAHGAEIYNLREDYSNWKTP